MATGEPEIDELCDKTVGKVRCIGVGKKRNNNIWLGVTKSREKKGGGVWDYCLL